MDTKRRFKENAIAELLKKQYGIEDPDRILDLYHNHISELKTRNSVLEQEVNNILQRGGNYDGINPT